MESGFPRRLAESARASPAEFAFITLLALVIVGGSALVFVRTSEPPAPPIRRAKAASPSPKAPKQILVHVAGVVAAPGVYELADGSRVKDAVDAAGGPADGADLNVLNLAAPLSDGQKVVVSKPGQAPAAEAVSLAGEQAAHGQGAAPTKVNLNTATATQLEELPAVGPVIAERIIAFRQQKGRFTSVRQLLDVEGVGPKKFEGLKDLVVL